MHSSKADSGIAASIAAIAHSSRTLRQVPYTNSPAIVWHLHESMQVAAVAAWRQFERNLKLNKQIVHASHHRQPQQSVVTSAIIYV